MSLPSGSQGGQAAEITNLTWSKLQSHFLKKNSISNGSVGNVWDIFLYYFLVLRFSAKT